MGDSYVESSRPKPPHESRDSSRARWAAGRHTGDEIAHWIHAYAQSQRRHAEELEAFVATRASSDDVLGTLAEPWQRTAAMSLEQARLAAESAKRADIEGNAAIRELARRPEIDKSSPLVAQGNADAVEEFQQLDLSRLNGSKSGLTSFASIEVDRAQGAMRAAEHAMQAWIGYDSTDGVQAFVAQIISGTAPTSPQTREQTDEQTHNRAATGSARTGPPITAPTHAPSPGSTHGSSQGSTPNRGPSSTYGSRQGSQATVQRKPSFSSRHLKTEEPKSGHGVGSGSKSKVGSIFGRKKNRSKAPANLTAPAESDAFASPRSTTRPPDFGPRQPSQASMRSNSSSPARSSRQARQRDYDDSLYTPSSPANQTNNPPTNGTHANTHAHNAQTNNAQTNGTHANGSTTSSTQMAPLTPTKSKAKSTAPRAASPSRESTPAEGSHNPPSAQAPSSPSRQAHQPAPGSAPGPSSEQIAPFSDPTTELAPPKSSGSAAPGEASPGSPPMPPPARHSSHRVPSSSRCPSSASAKRAPRANMPNVGVNTSSVAGMREPSGSRDSRVGSQVFSNLTPAPHDASRDSIVPEHASPAVSGASPPMSSSPLAREQQDSLGPSPHHPSNGDLASIHANQAVSGTPEQQFWTPAQRFAPQFQPFEQGNHSVLSMSSAGGAAHTAPAFPASPADVGLVAAAVEYVEAEYDGDQLVRSSVRGEAVARVNGAKTADAYVLGISLADPSASSTPSNSSRQTSSSSFDVPHDIYAQEPGGQELVQYTASSAAGRIPVKIMPIWRFEANTVRLVSSYQLSDLYVSGDDVTVHDLVITVTIVGAARAHSAQSKPVATFSREKQRVTWRFPQPQTSRRGQAPTKSLCQFVTDGGKAAPGKIEIRARIPTVHNSVSQSRTSSPQKDWVAVPTAVGGEVLERLENK